jgi:hypothetical protein
MPETEMDSIGENEQLLLAEMQVLLSELRTHLSLVRTGAGVSVGAISVFFLTLVNGAYLPGKLQLYEGYIYFFLAFLTVVGVILFVNSQAKILAIRRLIRRAKHENTRVDQIVV